MTTQAERIDILERKVELLEKTLHLTLVGVGPMLEYMDKMMEEIDGRPRPSDRARTKTRTTNRVQGTKPSVKQRGQ